PTTKNRCVCSRRYEKPGRTRKPQDFRDCTYTGMVEGFEPMIDLDGPRLVVATDNGFVVYERQADSGAWEETDRVDGPTGLGSGDYPDSLAFSSGRIAVGDTDAATDQSTVTGGIQIFEESGSEGWENVALLQPDDIEGRRFGLNMDMDQERVVGILPKSDSSVLNMIIMERQQDGSWAQVADLSEPTDPQLSPYVSISGDTVAMSVTNTYASDPTVGEGKVFVYQRGSDGSWSKVDELADDNPDVYAFGAGVALHDDRMLVTRIIDGPRGVTSSASLYERGDDGNWSLRSPLEVDPEMADMATAVRGGHLALDDQHALVARARMTETGDFAAFSYDLPTSTDQ
ncbi:MAG: hypothetical protein ACLFVJ_13285, partial [Persicimonas sp.]